MYVQSRRRTILGVLCHQTRHPANPTKVDEFMETPPPSTLRDVQGLNGKLTALSRFTSKSSDKAMPLFHTLKGCIEKSNFWWTAAAKPALQKIKEALHRLPTLASPVPGETLQVYLSTSNEAISSVLVVEREGEQKPVYLSAGRCRAPNSITLPWRSYYWSLSTMHNV